MAFLRFCARRLFTRSSISSRLEDAPHSFTHAQASPERGEKSYQCPGVAQRLLYIVCSRGSCSSSVSFPAGGRLLHIQTSAAFPSASGPLFPQAQGITPESLIARRRISK